MKRFIEKLKLTFAYYKSLDKVEKKPKKTEPQPMEDLHIRPDVYAFLTYPGALECEKRNGVKE